VTYNIDVSEVRSFLGRARAYRDKLAQHRPEQDRAPDSEARIEKPAVRQAKPARLEPPPEARVERPPVKRAEMTGCTTRRKVPDR